MKYYYLLLWIFILFLRIESYIQFKVNEKHFRYQIANI